MQLLINKWERFVSKHGRQPSDQKHQEIKAYTLSVVRGTVQADILKEDQAQNTCIFPWNLH